MPCLQAAEGAPAEAQATCLTAALVEEGALRAYGKAQQVPKRTYSLEELRLNRIQPEQFLAPADNTLGGVRNVVQGAFVAGLAGAYFSHLADLSQIVQVVLVAAFLLTVDQVGNAGGFEALLVDTGASCSGPSCRAGGARGFWAACWAGLACPGLDSRRSLTTPALLPPPSVCSGARAQRHI